jgi:hypothetical protein
MGERFGHDRHRIFLALITIKCGRAHLQLVRNEYFRLSTAGEQGFGHGGYAQNWSGRCPIRYQQP